MKRIKYVVSGGMIVLAVFSSLQAQDQETGDEDSTAFDGFPKNAVQFQVHDILELSDFQGGIISYKRHFNDGHALRVGIDLNGSSMDKERDRLQLQIDTISREYQIPDKREYDSLNTDSHLEEGRINFGINLQYVHYFSVYKDIKAYGGAGPLFNYLHSRNEESINSNHLYTQSFIDTMLAESRRYQVQDAKIEMENEMWEIGLTALFGVEWFVHEQISISAEYGFVVKWQQFSQQKNATAHITVEESNPSSERKRVERQRFKVEGSEWNYHDRPVKLGLTVYF